MTMGFQKFIFFGKRRALLILWISLVVYNFYKTFIYYENGQQFQRLRNILGLGLCISRGTATVLNLCSALILLPLCKKLNRLVYQGLSRVWPSLFFFWLERAKSFHMTVAVTLVLFAVIHSISHFANLWNFSANYDNNAKDLNLADYKNQNPLCLILTRTGMTGLSMLLVIVMMGATSLRVVRRKFYNVFWYTHQLYLSFLVLLLVHPLSGLLKEEILNDDSHHLYGEINFLNKTADHPRFISIESKTWQWMALPLTCFSIDLFWRLFARNRHRIEISQAIHMPGRTISLTLSCPGEEFRVNIGQYVLLQCADISLIEWHPFTVVQVPTKNQRKFTVWIRVAGDWTEALEKLLMGRGLKSLNMLVDGPFCSALESASKSEICICVAAGVGITPFVALLRNMLLYPRSRLPGRVHLIWIVRHEFELSWLAELANRTMLELRNANRPDRLHLELYITNKHKDSLINLKQVVVIEADNLRSMKEDEKATLLTPHMKRNPNTEVKLNYEDDDYRVIEKFPLLGCRVRRGRPHWDRVFGYWVHLYPEEKLHLYCCGPKKLVKLLRSKCISVSQTTRTKFTFVHEGFS